MSWCRCPVTSLGFLPCASAAPLPLLPLRGSVPLTGASACLTPVYWSTPGVELKGSLLRHLVFSHVPCSSSGPTVCAAFPAAGSLGVFRSPGVCRSASLVTWVGLQPFPSFSRIRRNLFIHKARIPARRFSSSTSQHFKMFPPFASNEGYSASGLRYQSDGARVTHPLPHSEFTRIRERTCDLTLTLSHSPFAYYSYISSYLLLIIPSAVL